MEDILKSVVVAAVVAGIVSIIVTKLTAAATVRSAERGAQGTVEAAEIVARVEREKLAHRRQELAQAQEAEGQLSTEERTTARRAFIEAVKAGRLAGLEDADWPFRRALAGEAREHLIEARSILGEPVSTPEVQELIEVLGAQDEEGLKRATDLWPLVEEVFIAILPRRF